MLQLYPPPAEASAPVTPPTAIYDDLSLPLATDQRPYTILNMVSSVDGKTTLDGGRVNELGSDVDHRLMLKLRIPVDAVIRGAGTVRSHSRYPQVAPEDAAVRQAAGRPPYPRVVIVTGSAALPLSAPVFREAPQQPLVITKTTAPAENLAALAKVAQVIAIDPPATGAGLNLQPALQQLRQKHGIEYLLSEGGPMLNYAFLAEGLLDELFWTIAPKLGGARDDLNLVDGPETLTPLPALELLSAYHCTPTGELFMRYKVV